MSLGLMTSDSDIARKAIFEILDNQLAEGNPPETREVLARLLADGHSEQEARRLIACVVASEVFAVAQEGREFDGHRYAQALRALPKLPWDGPQMRPNNSFKPTPLLHAI